MKHVKILMLDDDECVEIMKKVILRIKIFKNMMVIF